VGTQAESGDFVVEGNDGDVTHAGRLHEGGKLRNVQEVQVKRVVLQLVAFSALSAGVLSSQSNHSSSPVTQFVPVQTDVKLEVLDWGGSGRPLIFLAGMGNDAHVYDRFAPKLTGKYHVYGISRRGFGASSKPVPANGNYMADRLGDDVLAVMDALKLNRPVLVGHSFAGEELSSVGSRHPGKVAGLIYLDAAYGFAYYDQNQGEMIADMNDVKKRIEEIEAGGLQDENQSLRELEVSVSQLQKSLQESNKVRVSMPPLRPRPPIDAALAFGEQKYTTINVPILAIFAVPRTPSPGADFRAMQARAFEAGVPSAHVVRIPNADHYVFNSNEADVLREMNAFLAKLP
jgi:pimeloyl-ACP methyl ester carboxylesterase